MGRSPPLIDRDIIIRYIAAGRFNDGTGGGISVEGRATGGAWTEIAFLHGWAYAATRNQGDTVTDNDGVDFDVALDGGWRDATVSVPDTYDEIRTRADVYRHRPAWRARTSHCTASPST